MNDREQLDTLKAKRAALEARGLSTDTVDEQIADLEAEVYGETNPSEGKERESLDVEVLEHKIAWAESRGYDDMAERLREQLDTLDGPGGDFEPSAGLVMQDKSDSVKGTGGGQVVDVVRYDGTPVETMARRRGRHRDESDLDTLSATVPVDLALDRLDELCAEAFA